MNRRRTRAALLVLPIALLLTAALASITRVPAGHVGVTRGRVLEAGLHLTIPFVRPGIYPLAPVTMAGRVPAISPQGARQEVAYEVSAAVDPSRAGLLPAGLPGGDAARLAASLARLIDEELASAGRAGEEGGYEARLRRRLESLGLRVAGLSVRAAATPSSGAGEAAAGHAAARRPGRPILLVGLDGADWQIIDPLIAQGRLPHLAKLRARSVWGHLRSFEPILSPLLWTTAATGRPPDEHGVIDFLVTDPATGARVPITSRSRRTKALWNIFSERGLAVDVVAWWASWPAEAIRGRMVSDRVAYSLFQVQEAAEGLTWPRDLRETLRPDLTAETAIDHAEISRYADVTPAELEAARRQARERPENAYKAPLNHLAKILASTRSYHRIALRLLADGQPDLFAVYYQGIDEVSHRFAHYMPPKMDMVSADDYRRYHRAVEEFYAYQDALLGELLGSVAADTTVIVMSDHGFHNGPSRPTDGPADIEGKPGKWHRLYGIVMIAGEGIPAGRLDTATLFDIAPTVLALAGLPLAGDMRGRPLLSPGGGEDFPRIASYEIGEPATAEPARTAAGSPPGPGDEELLKVLESLGYIGSSGAAAASLSTPSPDSVTSHTNMASLLLTKGDLAGAEAEARRALAARPSYFPALMALGRTLVRQGRIEEALEATRQAVAVSEECEHGAYVQLALLAARAGQSRQARSFLDALAARRPRAAGIQTAFGVLDAQEGLRDEAGRRFRAALALEPGSPEAMGRLFQLYRERGRETDLEPEVRKALGINPRSVLHHNWLGLILQRRGDPAGAEESYRRALELAPDFGGTMANLGSLYGRAGRLEEAVRVLDRAVRIEPGNLEARVNLGASLAKLGRLDDAIASLEEARRMGLRSVELLNAVGLAYAQKGERRRAIEALQESLTVSPTQPRVRSLLSELTSPG